MVQESLDSKLMLLLVECSGADERIRTADLLITNQLLYQLSYVGLNQASSDTSVKVVARAKQSMLAHGYQLSLSMLIMHFF